MSQETLSTRASVGSHHAATRNDHIMGIDSLRAVAALTVMLDHLGLTPPDIFAAHHSAVFSAIRMVLNCLFNGPAAVVIFFVVSGFFIHLPQTRKNTELNIPRFYVRRGIRIGIPAMLAFLCFEKAGIATATGSLLVKINSTVLWSIVCEVTYYFLYPAILLAGKNFGWVKTVIIAYLVAFALCLTHLNTLRAAGNAYVALHLWTWVVGLPCWILGCWLAENRQKFRPATITKIWLWRFAIFAVAFLLRVAKFHFHSVVFSNCFTLNLFALPVTAWIGLELVSSTNLGTSRILEWIGQWSFSLYLIHPTAWYCLHVLGIPYVNSAQWYHLLSIVTALISSFIFYLVVEKPSHLLAVQLSRRTPKLAWATL